MQLYGLNKNSLKSYVRLQLVLTNLTCGHSLNSNFILIFKVYLSFSVGRCIKCIPVLLLICYGMLHSFELLEYYHLHMKYTIENY